MNERLFNIAVQTWRRDMSSFVVRQKAELRCDWSGCRMQPSRPEPECAGTFLTSFLSQELKVLQLSIKFSSDIKKRHRPLFVVTLAISVR